MTSQLRQRLLLLLEHREPAVRVYAASALADEGAPSGPRGVGSPTPRDAVEDAMRRLSVLMQERAAPREAQRRSQTGDVLRRLLEDLALPDPDLTEGTPAEDRPQVERRLEAIALGVRAVWARSTEDQRRQIIGSLEDAQDRAVEELGTEQLERRNAARVELLYARIAADSYAAEEVELSPGQETIGVRLPGDATPVYPRWQFDARRRPWPWLADVIACARQSDIDAVSLHRVMVRPDPFYESSPVELARAGRLDVVRRLLTGLGEMGG